MDILYIYNCFLTVFNRIKVHTKYNTYFLVPMQDFLTAAAGVPESNYKRMEKGLKNHIQLPSLDCIYCLLLVQRTLHNLFCTPLSVPRPSGMCLPETHRQTG